MFQIGCRRFAPHVQNCPRASSSTVIKKYGLNIRSNSKNLCRVTQKSKKRVCAGAVTRPEGSGARGEDDSAAPEQQLPLVVVVVECDGILVDIHNTGHRKAFNLAFEEMGYSCSQWSRPVYFDLLRFGDSTGPGLVKTYFDMVGWPIMLSTSDRSAFVEKIYAAKMRIFKDIIARRKLELREGVVDFIDDLIEDGICPVVIAGTGSAPEDGVLECVLALLGEERASKIQSLTPAISADDAGSDSSSSYEHSNISGTPINKAERNQQEEEEEGMSFERLIAEAQGKAKAQAAQSFARAINLQNRGVGMRVDPTFFAVQQRARSISPAYFAAIVAAKGGTAKSSVLVAASNTLMQSAKGAGLYTAGVPPSLAARGGYTAMDASFDGFGPGGGITWRKLKFILEAREKESQ